MKTRCVVQFSFRARFVALILAVLAGGPAMNTAVAVTTGSTGSGASVDTRPPGLGFQWVIATDGNYPGGAVFDYGEPFLGEIRCMAFSTQLDGSWIPCDGRLLTIGANTALFSVLGTTYGGNGVNNFAIPNLQGRVPMGYDPFVGDLGFPGGQNAVTLTTANLPSHSHTVSGADPTTATGTGTAFANQQAYLKLNLTIVIFGSSEQIGWIRIFPYEYEFEDLPFPTCDGQGLSTAEWEACYDYLGNTYGGNATTFNVPDLRGRCILGSGSGPGRSPRTLSTQLGVNTHTITLSEMAAHTHTLPVGNTGSTGGSVSFFDIMQPALVLNHAIAESGGYLYSEADPAIGEIRFFAGAIPQSGYLPCDGRSLPVNQNQVLYLVLQTQYGGPGGTSFLIPDLRGRHAGYAAIGSSWGAETLALSVAQLPAHTHNTVCSTPTILTARSVKTHSVTGDQPIDMGVAPSIGNSETRVGGTTRIDVTFNKSVLPQDGTWSHSSAGAEVNASAGTISSVQLASPTLLRILLSNVPNRTCLAVTLHGIACDTLGTPGEVMADKVIRQRVALGDISNNGKVTSADIGAIKLHLGLPGNSGAVRHDVNRDGVVNLADVNLTKAATNSLALPCP